MMMGISDSLLPLWILVICGGLTSLSLMVWVAWSQRGAATKDELHKELGDLEGRVDNKFERERTIARDANEKIYNRLNDCAKGVTAIEAKFDSMEKMMARLVDKEMNG